MYSKVISYEEFLAQFKFQQISYGEFAKSIRVVKYNDETQSVSLLDYVTKNNSHRRVERLPEFTRALYKIIVEEPHVSLRPWYERFVALPNEIGYYFDMPNKPILENGIFNGRTHGKYGRACRAINFNTAYRTVVTNSTQMRLNSINLLHLMYDATSIPRNLVQPAFYDMLITGRDYDDIWRFLMSYISKPSILNPYTYRGILNELFEGETLFAPCMSWNAAQIAFYNSHFKHFISTDVIPSVVENGRTLHLDYQEHQASKVAADDKTIDLYCCPSERLDERHQFLDRYAGKVDAVLFCPPYFDLELYDGGEQSIESFPNYNDWMKGYWEETVKLCASSLRKGGRFGFIISNYSPDSGKTLIPISDDMSAIVAKHLTPIGKYGVQWGVFKPDKSTPSKMKDGNIEDLWMFTKA